MLLHHLRPRLHASIAPPPAPSLGHHSLILQVEGSESEALDDPSYPHRPQRQAWSRSGGQLCEAGDSGGGGEAAGIAQGLLEVDDSAVGEGFEVEAVVGAVGVRQGVSQV